MSRGLLVAGATVTFAVACVLAFVALSRTDSSGQRVAVASATRTALLGQATEVQPTETPPPVAAAPPVLVAPVATEAVGSQASGFFDGGRTSVPVSPTAEPSVNVSAGPVETSSAVAASPVQMVTVPGVDTPATINADVDPALAQTVLSAYLRYWNVRIYATDHPDATDLNLESAMAGDELGVARQAVADYAARPVNQQSQIHHHLVVLNLDPSRATIADEFTSTQNIYDAAGSVLRGPYVETFRSQFVLEPVDGIWKVTQHIPGGKQ